MFIKTPKLSWGGGGNSSIVRLGYYCHNCSGRIRRIPSFVKGKPVINIVDEQKEKSQSIPKFRLNKDNHFNRKTILSEVRHNIIFSGL